MVVHFYNMGELLIKLELAEEGTVSFNICPKIQMLHVWTWENEIEFAYFSFFKIKIDLGVYLLTLIKHYLNIVDFILHCLIQKAHV